VHTSENDGVLRNGRTTKFLTAIIFSIYVNQRLAFTNSIKDDEDLQGMDEAVSGWKRPHREGSMVLAEHTTI